MIEFMWPAIGGLLIGLSATLLLLSIGKIAGISGITWGAFTAPEGDKSWRWVFLIGMLAGGLVFHFLSGVAFPVNENSLSLALASGFIVGVGVKIGNGCTSGHGVCGVGRLSVRSLVATLSFMFIAILTVAVFNFISGRFGV